MMGCWRNYIDISSYILFEATGDSETDCGNISSAVTNGMVDATISSPSSVGGLAEGDAFSCSCNNDCCDIFDHHHPPRHQRNHDRRRRRHRHHEEEDNDNEEDKDAVHQVQNPDSKNDAPVERINVSDQPPGSGVGGAVEITTKNSTMEAAGRRRGRRKKLKAFGKRELLNQKDKDRHFWETCLSS